MNKENLIKLDNLLKVKEDIQATLKSRKEEFEESVSTIRDQLTLSDSKIDEVKKEIEREAKQEFEESGNKKLLGGIGIQEKTKLSYNEVEAFAWAKKSEVCLQLDKKSFEKLAKSQDFDFVTKTPDIKVTYPEKIKLDDNNVDLEEVS